MPIQRVASIAFCETREDFVERSARCGPGRTHLPRQDLDCDTPALLTRMSILPSTATTAQRDYSRKVVKAETGSRSLTREFSMRDESAYPSDMLQTMTSSCGMPVISRTIVWK